MDQLYALFAGRLLTAHEVESLCHHHDVSPIPWDLLQAQPAFQEGRCVRCGNAEPQALASLPGEEGGLYCLACLTMGRITSKDQLYGLPGPNQNQESLGSSQEVLTWAGTLSPEQARASQALVQSLEDPRPHCVTAVTGAGKTEMIFQVLATVLAKGGRAGVASPRVDVCRELAPRLQEAFQGLPCLLLYGGSDQVYDYTPLVVLTTHQLLRFHQAFDLLIIDEVDAFPLAGDPSLHYGIQRALKPEGKLVYLTATPDQTLKEAIASGDMVQTTLPARYHGYPLPEPIFLWLGDWRQQIHKRSRWGRLYRNLRQFLALDGVKLIFMPEIALAEELFNWLSQVWPHLTWACVHSQDPDRSDKVQALREGTLEALVTTTILERGVTFTNCQVFIVGAEEAIYSVAALVQMSGRAGRRPDYPSGQVIYGHGGQTRAMRQARADIRAMNDQAQMKGLLK